MDVSFPAFAHRVTVLGSTRNIVATSAGVSNGSASGVRADIMTASHPGPIISILRLSVGGSIQSPALDVLYGSTVTILPSPAVTMRPPGAEDLTCPPVTA